MLVTPEAKAALSELKVLSAATQTLNSAGVKVVESESAPILVLSVDTLDLGNGLAFMVGLNLIEEVALPRGGEFLKTVVKSWDTSQFGSAASAAASDHLAAAVLKVLKKFTDGVGEGK